ncbi:MAG TPA: DUF1080 domain-containing protein [Bacteroidales bacterium]|nr:DUF1080 domain-containing protein [Bacteroidales bacterium]
MKNILFLVLALLLASCINNNKVKEEEWVSIFNGKDLAGWTVKISGYPIGENFKNTFMAADGVLKANYNEYDTFNGEFGHIYYNEKLSSYKLRLSYRFTGDQVSGAPGWAFRNSGIMLHCQDPATVTIDQDFPVSIEAQFLGGDGSTDRTTLNLCTPGTNVVMNGELITIHCINSTSETFHGDQWVNVEVIVYADSLVHHIVNGDTVITYGSPQIGGTNLPENYPLPEGTLLDAGYISLQAESHPVEFKEIKLLRLNAER